MDVTRNYRKQRAVELGKRFEDLGMTQDYVAFKIDLSKGYICRIFNEFETEFVPSEEALQRLEKLVVAEAEAMVHEIFEMGLMTVEVIETCNAPNAYVAEPSKELLGQRLVSALASIVTGKPGPIDLPDGIDGILAQIGEEPHSMFVIAVRLAAAKRDKRTLAHEYEDLSEYFWSKAQNLRSGFSTGLDRDELPKKMF